MILLAAGGTTDPKNVLHPCGLVMDFIRSAYRVSMVCRTGDPAILVDWYKADAGAKCLTFPSPFRSKNWEERFSEVGDLGEQPGPRTWKNGKKPKNGFDGGTNSLACAASHQDWWQDGLGASEETGPFNADGVPLCCVNGPTPPPIDLCGCTTAQELVVTLHAPANACLDGQSFPITWDETLGEWNNFGQEPQPCGDCFMELKFICVDAFPTQWLLLLQFKPTPGGDSEMCAGGSAGIDFTQCIPMFAQPFQVWIPDFGLCSCTNGIVADTVTFDLAEA